MWTGFLVFLGGGLGSLARWLIGVVVERQFQPEFPWATLLVNVSGSFVIGLVAELSGPDGRWVTGPAFRTFFMVGICGGYTTYSSFSLQTLALVQGGEWGKAGANVLGSVVLCLAAVWLGHGLATVLNSPAK